MSSSPDEEVTCGNGTVQAHRGVAAAHGGTKIPLGLHGRKAPQRCVDFCFNSSDRMRTRSPLGDQLSSTC